MSRDKRLLNETRNNVKNKRRKFESVCDVGESAPAADIQGVVKNISTMKLSQNGNKYYNGTLTDGKKTIRFVGFDDNSQTKIHDYFKSKKAVRFNNCTIKKSEYANDDFEVVIGKWTSVEESSKKFDCDVVVIDDVQEFKNVKVIDTFQMPDDSFVSLPQVTIQKKYEPRMTKRGVVTEIALADDTGVVILSVWNNKIVETLKETSFYEFRHVKIRSYMDIKSLTYVGDSEVTLLKEEDVTIKIDVTTEIKEDIVKHEIVSQECLLIGVRRLYIHVHCVYCDTILTLKDMDIQYCDKCETYQMSNSCNVDVSSFFTFKTTNKDEEHLTLKACKKIIYFILPPNYLITSVERCINDILSLGYGPYLIQHNGAEVIDIKRATID